MRERAERKYRGKNWSSTGKLSGNTRGGFRIFGFRIVTEAILKGEQRRGVKLSPAS